MTASARLTIGVMGSSQLAQDPVLALRLEELARRLGDAIADRRCILVTGATTGYPDLVSRAARSRGGMTIGISPAESREEHVSRYSLPDDCANTIIYTGFGLKGRNVVNVRSSDIVIVFGGGIGTLNEFTIAWDEGKIIGILEGTGGVTEQIREVVKLSGRRRGEHRGADPLLVSETEPEKLLDACLKTWRRQGSTIQTD
jgi:uncharacterized protein (TIGR00725 family)